MSKKLKNLKWDTVAIEGFPASVTNNLDGFVGLEECTSYGLDKHVKNPKKKKHQKKRKNTTSMNQEVPNKKVKLSNGFIVENCNVSTPSLTNQEISVTPSKRSKNGCNKRTKNTNKSLQSAVNINSVDTKKKRKTKLGDVEPGTVTTLSAEEMLSWAEFKLPEPILQALAEMGFKQPTKIQQLSLPAAIHGRRDILGAAETGSGKTLAFGLPILTGILKLKENAENGLDVYEIPYKKNSKKKKAQKPESIIKNKERGRNKKKEPKESSEDGYGSGEESDLEESESEIQQQKEIYEDSEETESEEEDGLKKTYGSEEEDEVAKTENDSEDDVGKINDIEEKGYVEEIEVPISKKREILADEGNESDDSDSNFLHLSDMLDSDDLADNSDDDQGVAEDVKADDEVAHQSADESESEIEEENIIGENNEGIGCVKVIDNISIPGAAVTRTGKPLYALILSPTRELAMQITRHLTAAAKYTGIRIGTVVGGMAVVKQERVLRSGPEIVVATPGRLWELVTMGTEHLQQLDSVKFLAIDETDRMIERSHFEELYPLLERLNADEAKRSSRQNFVFSATLTLVHDLPTHMKGKKVTKRGKILNRKVEKMTSQQKIKRLIELFGMTEPKVVDITTQNLGTAETLTQSRIACALQDKEAYLYYILKHHPGRTIVFCNSQDTVRRITQTLSLLRCRPLPLYGSMILKQRLRNLERFRDDPHGVLVATDVAARGLDVPNVDHVIHFQVPKTAENYVHRSGRTARASKEGLTILMMEPAEAYLYANLCHTLNKTTEVPTFPVPPSLLNPLKSTIELARQVELLELKKRRAMQAQGWRERAAREMDIIIDEDDIPSTKPDPALDKVLRAKKRDLDRMLSRPAMPTGFSYKYPTLNAPLPVPGSENALEVMKRAIQSGELKKEKRKSKNAPLLKLEKMARKRNVAK